MMRAPLILVALLLTTPAVLCGQSGAELVGAWDLTFDTPRGEQAFQVELTHTDTALAGTLTLPRGEKISLTDVAYRDGVLTFSAELGMGRRTMTHRFEGTLVDGVVQGEFQPQGGAAMGRPAMGGPGAGRRGGGAPEGQRPGMGPRSFTMERSGGPGSGPPS